MDARYVIARVRTNAHVAKHFRRDTAEHGRKKDQRQRELCPCLEDVGEETSSGRER